MNWREVADDPNAYKEHPEVLYEGGVREDEDPEDFDNRKPYRSRP